MKIFILEDNESRIDIFLEQLAKEHELTVAKDIWEARTLWGPPYGIICLDHDLGGRIFVDSVEENTGFRFVKDLLQGPKVEGRIYVHSWNPDAGAMMIQQLVQAGCDAHRNYFGPSLFTAIQLYLDEINR